MGAITNDWLPAVGAEFKKPYYRDLYYFVREEYQNHVVYPPADLIFQALHLTPLHEVKVVILGQDPYHNEHQAMGLSFSVEDGVDMPPSLVNIFRELHDDMGCTMPKSGNLTPWAKQGVLLLNTHGAGASGVFSPGTWLGTVHGCHSPGGKRAGQADCIYAVGDAGPAEGIHAQQSEASGAEGAASESSVRIPRFLWLPSFLAVQCISGEERGKSNQLAAVADRQR